MKKIFLITTFLLSFGCKNSSEELTSLSGSYIYFDDAAVLQTQNEIYGVYLNSKALELNDKAEALKTNSEDVFFVKIKGIVSTKTHEKILWENKLEIVEIESIELKQTINPLKLD